MTSLTFNFLKDTLFEVMRPVYWGVMLINRITDVFLQVRVAVMAITPILADSWRTVAGVVFSAFIHRLFEISNNPFPIHKTLYFGASKFMGSFKSSSTVLAGIFSKVSFVGNLFGTATLVAFLYEPSRPSAVLFAIISVIIYTVNGSIQSPMFKAMGFQRYLHVFLELFKRLPQTLNAATAVVLEVFMIWISRSRKDSLISHIEFGSVHSMPSRSFTDSVYSRAPARSRVSITEIVCLNENDVPTITDTFKDTSSVFDCLKSDHLQASESLSRQIYKSAHTLMVSRLREFVYVIRGDNKYIYA